MAEECTKAFGRYLKTLRERRKLSLENVRSLSQTFPDQINKGYLSRCENGHQRLSFSKVIPLSRIYEVPADVLVERMELDMELDRVGGPETEGLEFGELARSARTSLTRGCLIDAYAFARDAVPRAPIDPLSESLRDSKEQVVVAYMNCASMARALGRFRFALHEYLYLSSTGDFGPRLYPVILERIATTSAALRDFDLAEKYGELALQAAEEADDQEFLGYIYSSRGRLAIRQSNPALAAEFYKKAHAVYKEVGLDAECATVLNNLSQCYFDMSRFRAARYAAEAASSIGLAHKQQRAFALSQIMLGELDERARKSSEAVKRWKRAVEISKQTRDRELRFKAEFVLLRHSLKTRELAVARAIERRLRKLALWVSADTPELEEFRNLVVEHAQVFGTSVVTSQSPQRSLRN